MKTRTRTRTRAPNLMRLGQCLLATVITPSLSLASSAEVFGGGGIGNGGDMLVSEFTGSARRIALEISKQGNPSSCAASAEFLNAIDSTKVESLITVFKEGSERDAWNYPEEKRVEISRSRLINAHDPLNYLTVVLHEYLGILGIEKTNEFNRSQSCLQQLQIQGTELASLRHRINPLEGTIEKFAKGELKFDCHFKGVHPQTDELRWHSHFEFQYSPPVENPTKKQLKRTPFGFATALYSNGTKKTEFDFGHGRATLRSRLQDWQVEYDISTGLTRIEWSFYENFDLWVGYKPTHYYGGAAIVLKDDGKTYIDTRWDHVGGKFTYVSDGQIQAELFPHSGNIFSTADCKIVAVGKYGSP